LGVPLLRPYDRAIRARLKRPRNSKPNRLWRENDAMSTCMITVAQSEFGHAL